MRRLLFSLALLVLASCPAPEPKHPAITLAPVVLVTDEESDEVEMKTVIYGMILRLPNGHYAFVIEDMKEVPFQKEEEESEVEEAADGGTPAEPKRKAPASKPDGGFGRDWAMR